MRYGVVLPGGTASRQLAQAEAAERAGWDAVFVWETGYGVDPWSLLSAMAVRTDRVRLGTLLTPAPWRRPWKLASQIATLDQLSSGRAIVTLGLGAVSDDLPSTGETTDLRERAGRLDETIDLLRTLWAGGIEHHGTYFDVVCPGWLVEAAAPVQQAIPIWVAGAWPRPRSMQRALRCDGVVAEWHLGRPTICTEERPRISGTSADGSVSTAATSRWTSSARARRRPRTRRLQLPTWPRGARLAARGGWRHGGGRPRAPKIGSVPWTPGWLPVPRPRE